MAMVATTYILEYYRRNYRIFYVEGQGRRDGKERPPIGCRVVPRNGCIWVERTQPILILRAPF